MESLTEILLQTERIALSEEQTFQVPAQQSIREPAKRAIDFRLSLSLSLLLAPLWKCLNETTS